MTITLIGYRGCGKSTIGQMLADELSCEFVDTDELVELAAGKSIPEIFEQESESGFRARETAALESAYGIPDRVVSVGGGAVLLPVNREMMKMAGPVIWLTAPAEVLAARIAKDQQGGILRPALTGCSATEEVESVLTQRIALYETTATWTVATEDREPEAIVAELRSRLPRRPGRGDGA